ncbi:glycosyltransferase family 4 protein [uncultured Jatrophihabitans sp.]|uniref:glycosyltransferase family 4 protein n=1 Tax=uncultured Jatrophihabitans sp. TaxID=1610747 RepID=UPI0035C9BC52
MDRVLVAHPSADVYGSDRQLVESIAAVRAAGARVIVYLPAGGPLEPLLRDCTVRIMSFPVLRKALLTPRALMRLVVTTPLDLYRLVRTIRATSPDAVYVNTLTIPLWIVAARLTRTPVLVHVHEAEQDAPWLLRFLLALPLVLGTVVLANSNASRRVLSTALGRATPEIHVVTNGIPDAGADGYDAAEPGRLAVIGRLSPRKGIDVALEAVALLRADGRDVRLDVAGSAFPGYEWYEAQLRQRAERPDLAGRVRFLGYVHPTSQVLADACAVLVPSRTEPFGNTAVEALLAQRPVIASEVQGLAEIVHDGQTGLLVPPDDPRALATAAARVLDDTRWAARLAAAGRVDARERFGTERYQAEIVQAVTETARRRRADLKRLS